MGEVPISESSESLGGMTPATSEESVAVPDPSGETEKVVPTTNPKRASYPTLIRKAIVSTNKTKTGCSKRAIIRYVVEHYQIKKDLARHAIERTLKRMVRAHQLYRSGTGLYKIFPRGKLARLELKRRRSTIRKRTLAKLRKQLKRRKRKKKKKKLKKRASSSTISRVKTSDSASSKASLAKTPKSKMEKTKKKKRKKNRKKTGRKAKSGRDKRETRKTRSSREASKPKKREKKKRSNKR